MDAQGRVAAVVAGLALIGCQTASQLARAGAGADVLELRRVYQLPPAEWPAPEVDDGVAFVELGRVEPLPDSDDPRRAAQVELGKALFFDARLSGPGQMACASCHEAELGWGDGRSTSFGHGFQPLARNAPSILNVAFGASFFWDGRAATLEDQALAVFESEDEMHASVEHVVATVKSSRGYRARFEAAFGVGDEPPLDRRRRDEAVARVGETHRGVRGSLEQGWAGGGWAGGG